MLEVHLCGPVYLCGPFIFMGPFTCIDPFASVCPFHYNMGPIHFREPPLPQSEGLGVVCAGSE